MFSPLVSLALTLAGPPEDCGLLPPSPQDAPPPTKPGAATVLDGRPAVQRQRSGPHPGGALAGKTVYVSAGHGFVWRAQLGWRTQRGNNNLLVEDLVSAEAVDQYLIPYLQAMGAYVVPIRESDLSPELVIVDDDAATIEGTLAAAGPDEPGWGPLPLPLVDGDAPFAAGAARRFLAAADDAGRLVYAPSVPVDGEYNVYVAYVQGPDRAPDAHYIVRHAAGDSHYRVDQRRHGQTWVLLGKHYFNSGAGPDRAAVVLAADSAEPGTVLSADAVRLGGGVGRIDRGGGALERPMYEHAARYATQLSGAPPDVYDWNDPDQDDDVVSRSRFTAWEHDDGEDAAYIAWHSNAPDPGRGTSSYTYSPNPPPASLDAFTGTPGSRELQDAVHAEIVGDLRAVWDPAWQDDGRHTAYFGEVNPIHNPEVPAVLFEVAYHDTPADADQLRDPRFRRHVARAMAQGVARYFAAKDGVALVLPPEPPTAVALRNVAPGVLRVTWRPPVADAAAGDPPTHYRVHVSRDGVAFDDGTDVFATELELADLAAGERRYVRVAAVNAGGASLPGETLGARVAASGRATVAIVGGFDRLDAGLLVFEDLSDYALDDVQRMWLRRMNDGTYVVRHGEAVSAAGHSFDSATDDAVAAGELDLHTYQAVDWLTGQDSSGDLPLDATHRALLADYLDAGGRLLVSGAELGWAMDYLGTPEEQSFYRDRLRATYSADDAETYDLAGLAEPFADLPAASFLDPSLGAYDPEYPDVIAPAGRSTAVLAYSGGLGGVAAVAWGAGMPGERGVYLAFPFEVLAGADVRADVMARVLAFFDAEELPAPDPGDTTSDSGDDPSASAGSDADSGADASTGAPTPPDDATDADASSRGDESTGTTTGEDSDDGCGCTTTSPPSLALLALLALRRRRT